MNFPRFLVATFLLTGPVVAVRLVKQTAWGPVLAAPRARQTGNPKAKVVIVEYSDFQCPSCAKADPVMRQLMEAYKGKVRLIYKYYPLVKIHPNAMPSAHAADCAALQDRFWPYHDRLFDTQAAWEKLPDPTTSFMAIGEETKLDMPRFKTCYADPSRVAVIEQDVQEAQARQVTATPTFIIGDERVVGMVLASDGARTIEKALRQ